MRYMLWVVVACAATILVSTAPVPRAEESEAPTKRTLLDVLQPGQVINIPGLSGNVYIEVYSPKQREEAKKLASLYERIRREVEEIRSTFDDGEPTPEQTATLETALRRMRGIEQDHRRPGVIVEVGQDFVAYRPKWPAEAAGTVTYVPRERIGVIKMPVGHDDPPKE